MAIAVLVPSWVETNAGEGAGSLLLAPTNTSAHVSGKREWRSKKSSGCIGNSLGSLGICNQIK